MIAIYDTLTQTGQREPEMGSKPGEFGAEELVWVQLSKWATTCEGRLPRDVHMTRKFPPLLISGHMIGASPVTC